MLRLHVGVSCFVITPSGVGKKDQTLDEKNSEKQLLIGFLIIELVKDIINSQVSNLSIC